MLPVCHCSSGLLRSLRGIAAMTWIAALLFSWPVSRAYGPHAHNDAALSALNSSAYPRVTTQSELHEIVGILKDDRRLISLDYVGTNNPRDRSRRAKTATLALAHERKCGATTQVTGHGWVVWRQA